MESHLMIFHKKSLAKLSKGSDAKLEGLTASVDSQLQILLSLHCLIIYYTLCNEAL